MRKTFLFLCLLCLGLSFQAIGQQKSVKGTVTDSKDGSTIPGVSILIKGIAKGTITDVNGHYSIDVSPNDKVLVFSYIGMKTIEKSIGDQLVINVEMVSKSVSLNQVVVIGYGSVKKSDLTGSVASVNLEKLNKNPSNSFVQKMEGRISGVRVTQLSHQPGGGTSIRIRGGNSIMAGNEPLYVIDGVIIDSKQNFSWIGSPAENPLSTINPNDIASIEVLKDASATAIYGARGANGVVLITTKNGQSGKSAITFNASVGMQKKSTDIMVMDASQFARLYDEAGFNADPTDYTPLYSNPDSLGAGTDWQKHIFREAPVQNYQLTFSGGDKKTQYLFGGNYFSQEGIIVGSNFKRYSFRFNLVRKVSRKLKVGTHLSFSKTSANTVPTDTPGGFFPGVVNTALTFSPVLPVFNSDGNYTLTDPNADAWLDNPVAVTRIVSAINKTNRLLGNTFLEYSMMKGLTFKSSFGIDVYHQVQDMYTPRTVYSGSFNNSQARFATSDMQTYLWENTLTYDKIFHSIHHISAVGGVTFQHSDNRSFIDIATGYPNDILSYYGIENGENFPTILASFSESAMASVLGRINYNLSEKYLFTVTGRVDGSSKFGKNNRYAFFPSAAFAWRLNQEDFIKNLHVFYDLKLRISYGMSGNDRIPDYQFIRTLAKTNYYFNNTYPASGFAPDNPGNNNLKWETTTQVDVGLDMAFFDSRLSFTMDYYNKKTSGLLFFADLPWTSGYSSYMKNVGSMRNTGFELSANSSNLVNRLKWNTDFNISFNRNKILSLNGKELYISNNTYKLKIGNWAVIREGEAMGTFYGLVSNGIWQTNEAKQAAIYGAAPGDFKYVDLNNDGKINDSDRKIIGHALPDFTWGLNNSFSYKSISLDLFVQGVYGNQILNSNRFELESGNGLSNASINMLNRWTPQNPSTVYPRANRDADYLHMSDRYLEDGSYIRLKSITLTYDFPTRLVQSLKLSTAKLYATVDNLLTITQYSGFDPEVSRFGNDNTRIGYDYGGYPASKTYTLGITVNF